MDQIENDVAQIETNRINSFEKYCVSNITQ